VCSEAGAVKRVNIETLAVDDVLADKALAVQCYPGMLHKYVPPATRSACGFVGRAAERCTGTFVS
jgi:hypothetical protein